MSNRTSLRMRVLPRFPARIVGTDGFIVEQDNLDLVVKPDFASLTQVLAVSNPTKTLFIAWDRDVNLYQTISFQNIVDNIGSVIIGENLVGLAELTTSADKVPYFIDGDGNAATYTVSSYVRSVSGAVNTAAFLTAIGAGTTAQGALADTAVQPGDIGTAAYAATEDFATAEEGALANTALQPAVRNRYGEFPDLTTGLIVDNRAIIQNAIYSAVDNGTRTVLLPPGNFALSDFFQISTSGFTLRGCGKGVTNLYMTAAEKSALAAKSTDGSAIYDLQIYDFSIYVVDAHADAATNCIGIDMEYVAGGYIDVDVYNFGINYRLAGVFDVKVDKISSQCFQNTPNDRRIMYITKSAALYGGGAYGGNIYLSNCDMRSRANSGFPGCAKIIHVDAVDGLFVDNCYMGYADTHTAHIEKKSGEFISGVEWTGGWIDAHKNQGMVFDGTSGLLNGPCSVNGTHFFGGGDTTRNFALLGDWSDFRLIGATLDGSEGDNAYIETTGRGTQVIGSRFNRADGDQSLGGEGLNVKDTTGVIIANNVVEGTGYTDNGINVNGGSVVSMMGNTVTGCQNGISTSGALDNYQIVNNIVHGNAINNILDLATGTNKTVTPNIVF